MATGDRVALVVLGGMDDSHRKFERDQLVRAARDVIEACNDGQPDAAENGFGLAVRVLGMLGEDMP
jgi:hypothetical protein